MLCGQTWELGATRKGMWDVCASGGVRCNFCSCNSGPSVSFAVVVVVVVAVVVVGVVLTVTIV